MNIVKKTGAVFLVICMLVSLIPAGIAAEDFNLQITTTDFNLNLKDGKAGTTDMIIIRDGSPDSAAVLQIQVENEAVAGVTFEASFPKDYADAYGILTVTPVSTGTTTVKITATSGIDTAVGTLNVTVEEGAVDAENCIFVGSSEKIFAGTFAEACDEARKAEDPAEKKVRIKGKVGTYGVANIGGITLEGYTENREENILITTQESSHDAATGDGHDTGTGGSHDTGTAQADTVVRNLTVDANHYVNCPLRFMYDNVLVENVIVQHGIRAGINLAMSNSAEAKNMTFKNVLARDNRDCGFLLDCVGNAEGVVFENCRAENNYNLDCVGSELNGIILTNMYGDTYNLDMSGITVAEGTFSVEDRLVYGDGQADAPAGEERPQSKNSISWLQPPVDEAGNPVQTQTARYYNAGKYSGFQYGGSVAGRTIYINIRGRSYSQEKDTLVYYPDDMTRVNTDWRGGETIRGLHSTYQFTAEGPSVVKKDQQVEGSVTLASDTVDEAGYSNVRIKVEVVSKPEGAEDPRILANDGNQDYDLVKEGYWGPAEGFALTPEYNATTPLRLTFSSPGSYKIKYSLINIQNYNAVITEATADFTVQRAAFEFVSDGPSVIRQGEMSTGNVTLKGSEGNDSGYSNVRIKIELLSKPEGASMPQLVANDGNKDYNLFEVGYWGPPSGFEIAPDYSATTPLKAVFDEPGAYTVKYSLVDVSDGEAVITEKTDTITVQAVNYCFASEGPAVVKQNQQTAGNVTLASGEGNEASFENARIKIEVVEKPEGASNPKIIANDGTQDYDLVELGYWGPARGFAVGPGYHETTPLKATFYNAGQYTIKYSLVDVANQERVITEKTDTITVQAVNYSFASEGPDTVKQNQKVSGSVTLASEEGNQASFEKVRIKIEVLEKPEGASNPKIIANDGTQDYDLVQIGYWGPEGGFALPAEYHAVTPLKITFADAGNYKIKYSLIDLQNNNAIITEATSSVKVQASAYQFISEGPSVVRQNEMNTGKVTLAGLEGNEAGYSNARIKIELLSKPEGASMPQLIANDGNKDYNLFEVGYWGPASGFEITPDYSAATPLKAIFYEPGAYTIKYSLVDVLDGEAVITEKTDTITVQAIKYSFDFAGPEVVKQNQEVSGSVTLASQEGNEASFEKVRIKVEVLEKPEGAAAPKIIANDGTRDYDLAQIGYWGPENGFALPAEYSAATPLKVTFADPGSYSIRYSVVDLEREEAVITQQTVTIEVQKVKIELSPEIIIGDEEYNASAHPAQVEFTGTQPDQGAYLLKYKKSTEEDYTDTVPVQAGTYTAKLFLTEQGEASYILTEAAQKEFSILPREVVLTYDGVITKEYDASEQALVEEAKIILQNIMDGDQAAVSGALNKKPVYTDAAVGKNKTITVQTDGLLLDNPNYKLPASFTLLGDITAKTVQIGLIEQKTRTYGDEAEVFTAEDFELKNGSQFAGADQLSDFFESLDIISGGLAKQANARDEAYPVVFGEQSLQPDNYQITLDLSNGVLVQKRNTQLSFQAAQGLVYKNDVYTPQQLVANAVIYPADGPEAQTALAAEDYTLEYHVQQQGQDAAEIKNAGTYQIQLSAAVKNQNYNIPSATDFENVAIEKAVLSAIAIEHEPEKMKYISEVEKFDLAGAVITAVYNDETPYRFKKDITGAAVVSAPEHAKNGEILTTADHGQQVEFTYHETDTNVVEEEKTVLTVNPLAVEEKRIAATVVPLEDTAVTLKAGESVSAQFTARVNVTEPEIYNTTYQWYQAGEEDALLEGETQASLTITVMMKDNGSQYYCNVTVTADGYTPFTARTNTATLTVQKGTQENPQVQIQQPVAAAGDGSLTITGRAGAFIGIYSDAECEHKIGNSILLDQNGEGSAVLAPDSYYVRCEETGELNAGAVSGPYVIKNCYRITYNKGHFEGAGELGGEAPQVYLEGEEINLNSIAYASGSDTVVQKGWFTSSGVYNNSIITGAEGNVTVTAAWELQVPVTAKAVAGEAELEADVLVQPAVLTYTDALNQDLATGEVSVQAPAMIGDYKFKEWQQTVTGTQFEGEGSFHSSTNQTTYQAPAMKTVDSGSAVLITAVYEKITSKITAPVAQHGNYTYKIGGGEPILSGQDYDAVEAGETVSISATPDLNYRIDAVTVQKTGGTELVTVKKQQDGMYSFVMPSYNITLTVRFSAEPVVSPTVPPTVIPTTSPTSSPTVPPVVIPTTNPTVSPTVPPTEVPTTIPTVGPTTPPTISPTTSPSPTPWPEAAVRPQNVIHDNGVISGTAIVEVNQVLAQQQAADIIVGIYKNDTLVLVCKESELLQQGSNQVSIDFNIQGADDGEYTIKAFVWDSAAGLTPVTETATGRIE